MIFFLYLDTDEDDSRVCNELFSYLKTMMEKLQTNSDNPCGPSQRRHFESMWTDFQRKTSCLAHLEFLDRNSGSECKEKVKHLMSKFTTVAKILSTTFPITMQEYTYNEDGRNPIAGKMYEYELAINFKHTANEASLTFFLKPKNET